MGAALTRVCRLFHSACVAIPFRDIELHPKNTKAGTFEWTRQLVGGGAAATALAGHVLSVTFKDWSLFTDQFIYRTFLKRAMKALTLMPHITKLRLRRTPLPQDTLVLITTIASLETLQISKCTFTAPVSPLLDKPRYRLEELDIELRQEGLPSLDEEDIANLGAICTLDSLKVLKSDNPLLTVGIFHHNRNLALPLVELHTPIPKHEEDTIVAALVRTPALRVLHLESMWEMQNLNLLQNALPHLHTIAGPLNFLRKIVPGRPIRSITFDLHDILRLDSQASAVLELKQSSVPVVHLSLDWSLYNDGPCLHEHFPQVTDLEVYGIDRHGVRQSKLTPSLILIDSHYLL